MTREPKVRHSSVANQGGDLPVTTPPDAPQFRVVRKPIDRVPKIRAGGAHPPTLNGARGQTVAP